MEPLTREDFRALFAPAARAFHLELRDAYGVDEENGPFLAWLNSKPDDMAWRASWLDHARVASASGAVIRRLRVVSVPLADFVRWEHSLDPGNLAAGEDVRYLPRDRVPVNLPAEDYWLFDDDTLVLSLFEPDGRSGGFARVDDRAIVAEHRAVRDALWPLAVPSATFAP